MTRDEIKLRVLQCVDEVSPESVVNFGVDYPIDAFLDEAALQVIRLAPLSALGGAVADFSSSPVMPLEDGSGVVELPDGFVRLKQFKMKGWKRPVTVTHSVGSDVYLMQFNRTAKAGCSKPVVIIDDKSLCYFSLPAGAEHVVESAEAVVSVPPAEGYPQRLIAPLAWLTASKVLSVLNEHEAATAAREHYQEQMNLL